MSHRLEHVLRAISAHPWAIERGKLEEIIAFLDVYLRAPEKLEEMRRQFAASPSKKPSRAGAVAVLPIQGTIFPRANMLGAFSGGTSVERIREDFRAALNDPEVDAIVFDVDSPGGYMEGVPELAEEIFRARGTKPIVAVANGMIASAAYWLAAAADEVMVLGSGSAGSIGVIVVHWDESEAWAQAGYRPTVISAGRYKAEGNPYEPLSEAGRDFLQRRVDEAYDWFVEAVARFRGATPEAVRNGYGEGRSLPGRMAVEEGLADSVGGLEEAIRRAFDLAQGEGASRERRRFAAGETKLRRRMSIIQAAQGRC